MLSKCATIEAVLRELGTFKCWSPAEGDSKSLLKRAVVKELRHRHGDVPVPQPAPQPEPMAPQPEALRQPEPEPVSEPPEAVVPCKGSDEMIERGLRMQWTQPKSIMEGWVWKRSRILKTWRRRWLVLLDGELYTLKSRSHQQATEVVPMDSVLRVQHAEGEIQQPRCFKVVSRQRIYYLVCDDEKQKRDWIEAIDTAFRKKNT